MKQFYVLSVFFFLLTITVNSQTFEWANPDTNITANRITLDKAGNSIICGNQFVAKYDGDGNILWQKNIMAYYVKGIVCDSSNNIYVTGVFGNQFPTLTIDNYTITAEHGSNNMYLIKFNAAGVIQWLKQSRTNNYAQCIPDGLSIDQQGNPMVLGRFNDSLYLDNFIFDAPQTSQLFLAKYSPAGDCIWAKHLVSESFSGGSNGPKIKSDRLGNTYISGHFITHAIFDSITIPAHGNLDMDIFLAKIDTTGNFLWAKALGGAYQETSGPMDVDSTGNIYISGYYESPTAYFDTYTLTTNDYSYFTAKYSTDGSCQWVKQAYTGTLCATTNGYYTNAPGLISCYDALGDLQWTKTVTGANNVAMASAGTDVYITGTFSGIANFDSHTLSSSNSQMYIAKLGTPAITTSLKENIANTIFTVYPNPGNGLFTIRIAAEKPAIYTCTISTVTGQTVYTEAMQAADTYSKQVNLSALPKGSYYVNLYCGSSLDKKQLKECRKIVIQ